MNIRVRKTALVLLIFTVLTPLILDVKAENPNGPFKDNCPRYPVCIMPQNPDGSSGNGITINTKYGQLVPLRNMIVDMFAINANGSIYFDLRNLVPQAEEILRFNLQSYGNGTFEVQFWGPPAVTVDCQGCPIDSHLSVGMAQSGGVDLFFNGNMKTMQVLTVNYAPFGGACFPVCIGSSRLLGLFFWGAGIFLLIAVLVMKRPRREKESYEMYIGRDEE